MKFTVNSIDLQRTLSKIGGVVPAKSTMPILENILFDLKGDDLTITATDLAISLSVTVKVKGSEDGKVALPSRRLMDTMRSLPDVDAFVSVDTATNKAKITTQNGEYSLTGENAKDYPEVAGFKGSSETVLDNGFLRRLIHRTTFAVSTDELRPAMMGVLLQAKGKEMRAVSTDGHRLVRLTRATQKPSAFKKDVVVPAKALVVLGRTMDEGETTISVDDTHIRFTFGSAVLTSRLIDETYPNYESVIPAENDKELTVNRDEMISSIRRVALYANATTHQVRFDITPEQIKITAQDIDFGGEARETLSCTYTGSSLEIGFNSNYMIEVLSHLESEKVALKFSTPTRAGIISPVPPGGEEEDIIMLVMPVRLNN